MTLTLRCVHDENEIGHLIRAIGSCKALKQLRLDLDTTMSSGGGVFLHWDNGGKSWEKGETWGDVNKQGLKIGNAGC